MRSLPAREAERSLRVDAPPAIEQPTRFELVINAKTARELGLTIPAMLGMRVDRIVN